MLRNVIVSNIYNNLLCISINNTPVYPENASVCSLVSQEEMVGKDALFSFFLNPFSDELYLKSEASTPAEILLYDLSGLPIPQKQFTRTPSPAVAVLPKGAYVYELRNQEGLLQK